MTEPSTEALAQRARDVLERSGRKRVLITITGVPGSGKTTVAAAVAAALNAAAPGSAAVVGMDGFHLTRAQLSVLPDPERAHRLRGAPFTFDARGAVDIAARLREPGAAVAVPTFDHAVKDPVAGGLTVPADAAIVLYEGLYLQLQESPWDEIAQVADDTWRAEAPPPVVRERLARRHVASGIVADLAAGYERADSNDMPNGEYLLANGIAPEVHIRTAGDDAGGAAGTAGAA